MTKPQPWLPYLKYATLEDVREHMAPAFVAWMFLTAIIEALIWMTSAGESAAANLHNPLPKWLTAALVICVVGWFVRGKTLSIPMWPVRVFVTICMVVLASAAIAEYAPPWAWAVYYTSIGSLGLFLEDLNGKGQEHYEAMQMRSDAAEYN